VAEDTTFDFDGAVVCWGAEVFSVVGHGAETVTKVVAITISYTSSAAGWDTIDDGTAAGAGAGGPLYEFIQDTR
jgi:hypothetical protein